MSAVAGMSLVSIAVFLILLWCFVHLFGDRWLRQAVKDHWRVWLIIGAVCIGGSVIGAKLGI